MFIHKIFLEYKKKIDFDFIVILFHLFLIFLPFFVQLNFYNFSINLLQTYEFVSNFPNYHKTLIAPISIFSSVIIVIRFIFLNKYLNIKKILIFCVYFLIIFSFLIFIYLNYQIFKVEFLKTYLSLLHLFIVYKSFKFILKKIEVKKRLKVVNFYLFLFLFMGFSRIIDLLFFTKNIKYLFGYPLYNLSDYYPFTIFLSTLILFYFYKSRILKFLLFIFFVIQIFFTPLDNQGLNFILFIILPFLVILFYFKSIKNFIIVNFSTVNLFLLFCIINFFYLIIAHLDFFSFLPNINNDYFINLKNSVEGRFRIINFIIGIQDLNLFNFLFPNLITSRIQFSGYAHNDFLDMYFNIGIFSLLIYYVFSKKIFILFKYNNFLGIFIFVVLLFGSIVQNNILNIYLHQHLVFLFLIFNKNSFKSIQ
jgi:hypothetical protein